MQLIVKSDTIFKLQPVDSNALKDDQKLHVPAGASFIVEELQPNAGTANDHDLITFETSLGSALKSSKSWFVYKPHVDVIYTSAIVKTKSGNRLNVRSEPNVSENNIIDKLPAGTEVELFHANVVDCLWWYGKAIYSAEGEVIIDAKRGWMSAEFLEIMTGAC